MSMTLAVYDQLVAKLKTLGFAETKRPAKRADFGRWNCNNDLTIVVTTQVGQVYQRRGRTDDTATLLVLEQICPLGRGELASPSLQGLLEPNREEPDQACQGTCTA